MLNVPFFVLFAFSIWFACYGGWVDGMGDITSRYTKSTHPPIYNNNMPQPLSLRSTKFNRHFTFKWTTYGQMIQSTIGQLLIITLLISERWELPCIAVCRAHPNRNVLIHLGFKQNNNQSIIKAALAVIG